MRDVYEFQMIQSMMGNFSSGQVWLVVALMLALFAAATFRPEAIRSPTLFRLACVFLALSLLIDPALKLLTMSSMVGAASPGRSFSRGGGDDFTMIWLVGGAGAKCLLALGVLNALLSVGKPRKSKNPSPAEVHPLDE